MPKTFYTERDIEDFHSRGVSSIDVNDDIVITDLARERARKLGVDLVREKKAGSGAASTPAPAAVNPAPSKISPPNVKSPTSNAELQRKVHQAVMAKLGDAVDPKLLETIISRVLQSVGRK
ncbi:MAG: hypothetical protein N2D54_00540 [Chloroflexota bacterium]